MSAQVYSIGHSRHRLDKLVDLLRQHRIGVVIDVRSQPYSRFSPQFNRRAFERSLEAVGIGYRFEGDALGGRPSAPASYDRDGHALYSRMAATPVFLQGLERLQSKRTDGRPVAIVCSEEDPKDCHRLLLIGRVLATRGVDVKHIRGDGSVQLQSQLDERIRNPSLFAQAEEATWRSVKPVRRGDPDPSPPVIE